MSIAVVVDVHMQGGAKQDSIARAFGTVFDVAAARGCEAVVVGGDVYDDVRGGMENDSTMGDVQYGIVAPMVRHPGMRKIVIPGNHDNKGPGHRHALEHLRGVAEVHDVPTVVRVGQVAVALVPWAWNTELLADPELRKLPRGEFQRVAGEMRRDVLRFLSTTLEREHAGALWACVGHGEVDGAVNRYVELPPGRFHTFQRADLEQMGVHVHAWGHYHKRQMDIYVGSLTQLNAGEEGNPTGFLIIHDDGTKEWQEVESPRYYTVRTESELADLMPRIRLGDDVKYQAVEKPALPAGVRFDHVVERPEPRRRSDVTVDATPLELLAAWQGVTAPGTPLEVLAAFLGDVLQACPSMRPSRKRGNLQATRQIRLKNIGPYGDLVLDFPAGVDGAIGVVGDNGSGKTFLLEAPAAIAWGGFPSYPGPLYDRCPEGFTGDAEVGWRFEALGRLWDASRRLTVRPKTKSQDCYLFEVVEGRRRDVAVAGPGEKQFEAAMADLLGDKDVFFASNFASQDDVGSVVDLEPRDRMGLARRWMEADRFDAMLDYAKATLEEHQDNLKGLAGKLTDLPHLREEVEQHRLAGEAAAERLAVARSEASALGPALDEMRELLAAARAGRDAADQRAEQTRKMAQALTGLRGRVRADRLRLGELEKAPDQARVLRAKVAALADLRAERARLEGLQADRSGALQQVAAIEAKLATTKAERDRRASALAIETREQLLVVERRIGELQRSQGQRKQDAEKAESAQKAAVTVLERAITPLERAGCAAAPLKCAFIDMAVESQGEVGPARERLAELQFCVSMEGWRDPDEDANLALALQVRAGLVAPNQPPPEAEDLDLEDAALLEELAAVEVPQAVDLAPVDRQIAAAAQAERDLGRLEAEVAELDGLRERTATAQAELDEAEAAYAGAVKAEEEDWAATEQARERALADAVKEQNRRQAEVERLVAERASCQSRQEVAERGVARLEGAEQQAEQLRPVVAGWADVVRFLGPTGVPQLLIDASVPRLNELLDEICRDMNDERFVIRFETQRQLKNGRAEEGLFIMVTDRFGTRDVKYHSRGEKQFQRRLIRLALGLFEAERQGLHHEAFFLDEPENGIIPRRHPQLVSALNKLASRFRQIWLITHSPVLQTACPVVVELSCPERHTEAVMTP